MLEEVVQDAYSKTISETWSVAQFPSGLSERQVVPNVLEEVTYNLDGGKTDDIWYHDFKGALIRSTKDS